MQTQHLTAGFIGLGLIGGSIARALKKQAPSTTVMAYMRSRDRLLKAQEDGAVDIILEGVGEPLRQCDIIFLCTPVEYNASYLEQIRPYLKPGAVITDVGSTKTQIHEAVQSLAMEESFIGGHPMAGSEKTGYENSTDHLLENAYYILTPTDKTPESSVAMMTQTASLIGAIPLVLDYREHDRIVAAVSHLPHIIASALVNLVNMLDSDQEYMKTIAAGGFRDITRIASSSPIMWEQICVENNQNISNVLDDYIRLLVQIKCFVDNKDSRSLYQMFASSRDYRDSIDVVDNGLLKKAYVLYLDIADEAGGIATIATILAMEKISIKNIGIIHNREFEEGVLKIEFYDGISMEKGAALLKKRNYIVYER